MYNANNVHTHANYTVANSTRKMSTITNQCFAWGNKNLWEHESCNVL